MKELLKVLKLVIMIGFGLFVLVVFLPVILLVFLVMLLLGSPGRAKVWPNGFSARFGRDAAPAAAPPSGDTIDIQAVEIIPEKTEPKEVE